MRTETPCGSAAGRFSHSPAVRFFQCVYPLESERDKYAAMHVLRTFLCLPQAFPSDIHFVM